MAKSFAELLDQTAKLSADERKQLMGKLIGLQIREDDEYRAALMSRRDEKDPAKWTDWEDARKQLGI